MGALDYLYVYGDGRVVWQVSSPGHKAPTCRDTIPPDKVNDLIHSIIDNHFFELPEKRFVYEIISQNSMADSQIHSIAIDDGVGKAIREFGIGLFAGKQESIPPGFSSIEKELNNLRAAAFPPSALKCDLGPKIDFWGHTSPPSANPGVDVIPGLGPGARE
jgi:hypothetical protein